MKSLSLRAKLAGSILIPLVVLAAIVTALLFLAGTVRSGVQQAKERSLKIALLAKELQFHTVQVQQYLSDVSATRALDGLDDGFKEAEAHHAEFLSQAAQLKDLFRQSAEPDGVAAVDRLERAFGDYYSTGRRMASVYVASGPAEGNKLMGGFDKTAQALTAELGPLVTSATAQLGASLDQIEGRVRFLRDGVLVCGAIALLVSLGFLWANVRAIVRPLERLSDVLAANATDTAAAAIQLQENSNIVAHGTTEQAAAIEKSNESLEVVATLTSENAARTKRASELVKEARANADAGRGDLQEMDAAMSEIQKASEAIGGIIRNMDEIAFQTNILALNAAVEAARAGESGAGFAVVADEVRNLAQRSAAAAKESSVMIADATTRSVQGKAISSRVIDRLGGVLDRVLSIDDLMSAVVATSQLRNARMIDLKGAMKEMEAVMRSNAAGAEESASASTELQAQAETLRGVVASLEELIDGTGAHAARPDRPPSPAIDPEAAAAPELAAAR